MKRPLCPSGCGHLLRAETLSTSEEEFCCLARLGWGWSLLGDKIRPGFVQSFSRFVVWVLVGYARETPQLARLPDRLRETVSEKHSSE